MRFSGTINVWNDDRGFGFIASDQGGEAIFIHVKAFRTLVGRPYVGQRISFGIEPGQKGGKRAVRAEEILDPKIRANRNAERGAHLDGTPFFAIAALAVLLVALSFFWRVPRWLPAVYLVMSFVSFVMYASDKAAARQRHRRTAEKTLLLIGLLGGWPGAIAAQQFQRHKNAKASFQFRFWISVVANFALLVFICSPEFAPLMMAIGKRFALNE